MFLAQGNSHRLRFIIPYPPLQELSIDWSVATHTTVSHMVSSLILLYGTEAQKEKWAIANCLFIWSESKIAKYQQIIASVTWKLDFSFAIECSSYLIGAAFRL